MGVGENLVEAPVLTRTRGADGNLKRSTASPPPWTWRRRRPIVADVIRARRWSWMTVQECTPRQRADLIRMFERRTKHRWLAYAVVNVGVLWDDDKWELERAWHAAMKGGGRKRYTAIVALRRRSTNELFMFCSAHLSVHEPAASMWRLDQALRIHEFLGALAEQTECQRVLIGADLNSESMAPDGPRGILTERGYRSLFDIFTTEQIRNGTADTHKGFAPATERHNSRRIDDVLSIGVTLYAAEIVETHNGTDHRFIEVGAHS